MFKRFCKWWPHRKVVAPLKVETISEARLQELFLNAPNNPLWQATLAVLDLEVQESLETVIDETLTNELMRFRVGAVAGLLQFKQKLLDREKEARQTQAQAEAKEKEEQ